MLQAQVCRLEKQALYELRTLLAEVSVRTWGELSLVADLHIHTTASDGTYTPEELSPCPQEGITTIAITDHDSVDNVISTMRGAEQGVRWFPVLS